MEASVWFPVLLVMIIIGLLAGLIIYQHAVLYSLAVRTAERVAYSWDNSYKLIDTGEVDSGRRDGLYWRLTSDGAVPFLTGSGGEPLVYELPGDDGDDDRPLPARKLLRSSPMLPAGIHGEIRFENHMFEKVITVKLTRPLSLPPWLQSMFDNELHVAAERTISDPAEYLRGINLIRTYTGIAKEQFSPQEAKSLFREPLPDGRAANVSSHSEAARWVRLQTGGREASYSTSLGIRLVDSLTSDNIAHQAFFSYRESQVIVQADKDAELLRAGTYKKVVWHFFLGTDDRLPPPSQRLLDELTARGIQAEIHPGGAADAQ